jgi:uncharacterized repeat protein (TIGR04076 family)
MAQAKFYKVSATIISQRGKCEAGHKVGDEFLISDKTPTGMCAWAFYTVFPFASALQVGGSFPWEEDEGMATVACPDPTNPVIFELKRLRKQAHA